MLVSSSSNHDLGHQVGYAQQQDVHVSTSTVREALEFSALLRQPQRYTTSERLQYVEEVIALLGMAPFANAIVGEVGEGIVLSVLAFLCITNLVPKVSM